MTYWQIASGAFDRDYADYFIRHGLAFVGGDWQCDTMSQVQVGDVVILKRGTSQLIAAGYIVERGGCFRGYGDKEWLRDFDGWDLAAWCYVNWHKPESPVTTYGLTQSTITRTNGAHLIALANNIMETYPERLNFDADPVATSGLSDDELIGNMIEVGLRPGAAEELNIALRQTRLLAGFYLKRDLRLTKEHEARSFLVLPLLIALGWPEQRMQIEFAVPGAGRVDIACFQRPVKKGDEPCTLIIEAKGLDKGLDYAPQQAHAYAQHLPECNTVIVTNGYCYKGYNRSESGAFLNKPEAYFNLVRPTMRYPLDPVNVGGAFDLLRMLMPK